MVEDLARLVKLNLITLESIKDTELRSKVEQYLNNNQ